MNYPVLYSFRRCPYAMRARLALKVSGIKTCLREVDLKNKPSSLKAYSTKATVPILVLSDQRVLDESLEIMVWALNQYDPFNWLLKEAEFAAESSRIIAYNDNFFKMCLDQYKYADRFTHHPQEFYRGQGERFLDELEDKLASTSYLLCERASMVDMAILPFIRQFAHVDKPWFDHCRYIHLRYWMDSLLNQSLFTSIMNKNKKWQEGDPVTFL